MAIFKNRTETTGPWKTRDFPLFQTKHSLDPLIEPTITVNTPTPMSFVPYKDQTFFFEDDGEYFKHNSGELVKLSPSEYADALRRYFVNSVDSSGQYYMSDYLRHLTDAELVSLVNESGLYSKNTDYTTDGFLGMFKEYELPDGTKYRADDMLNMDMLNTKELLAYLNQLVEARNVPMPEAINVDAISEAADKEIQDEVDALINSAESHYSNALRENNAMYNDRVTQILSNDYQKNAQLLGTVSSELSKSRRNALEAGANAGVRLAENVNTLLAIQNKQSQQTLETSNQLAQMLLQQRQAAAGIRGDYRNDVFNLNNGLAERKSAHRASALEEAEYKYNVGMNQFEKSYGGIVSDSNPFKDNHLRYMQSQYSK